MRRAVARAYLSSFCFWCALSLLMGLQYQSPDRHQFWSWLLKFLLQVVFRALNFCFWTPPIFYLVREGLARSKHHLSYVLTWSLGAVPFVLLCSTISWILIPGYDDATHSYIPRSFLSWCDIVRSSFADQIFIYISIVVAAHAYEYFNRLRREERERFEYQQALAASQLQVLKTQIQPHFLFNTLHGIATLVDVDGRKAKMMILKLSNLLRTALDAGGYDLIPLQDELKFVNEYLDIEKMRLGNRLEVEWSVSPDASCVLVPQMILQPLVENAIRHGIAPARDGGRIEIGASTDNGSLQICVHNSVSCNISRGCGVGLRNVESRLKHLYSGGASLQFKMVDHTATACLTLPAMDGNSRGFATVLETHNLR